MFSVLKFTGKNDGHIKDTVRFMVEGGGVVNRYEKRNDRRVYVVMFRRRGVPVIGRKAKTEKKNTKKSRKIKKIITIPGLWVTARSPRDVFAGRKTVPARVNR